MDMERHKLKPQPLRFRLEAKVGVTTWQPVEQVYPELAGNSFQFASRNEAAVAKGQLKSYLKIHRPKAKVPIRIAEVI
jgi:hypothetical protein